MQFVFGDFKLDARTGELTEAGILVPVEPQVFEVIRYLVENRDRIVAKDELVKAIWDGRAVSDTAVTSRINFARRVLGDDGKRQQVIRTYPRRGFRFVADASQSDRAVTAASTQIEERPAIAVLPFSNLSATPEDEIVGEGICEDLATALSAVRLYRIISRSSTKKYRELRPDLAEIASELGAAFVISGSYRRAGNRLRISVQLDDAVRGEQLWARRFDGNYEDIFGIQDDVVAGLIGQLEPELDELSYRRHRMMKAGQLSAWELYHRAMMLVAERKMETTLLARDYFERAIELDPDFCRAYAGLSQVHGHIAVTTGEYLEGDEVLQNAEIAVSKDARDFMAQTSLGIAKLFRKDLRGSLQAHERAIELNPHNAQTRAWYAETLMSAGKAGEAIVQLELAIRLSPSDPWIGPFYGRLSRANYYVRNFEEAIEAAEAAFNYAHHWPVYASHTASLVALNRPDEARRAFDGLLAKMPDITAEFIRTHLPEWHEPYSNMLIGDLQKVGLN